MEPRVADHWIRVSLLRYSMLLLAVAATVLSTPVLAGKDAGQFSPVRFCTYNVYAFRGWPAPAAHHAFAGSSQKRLAYFVDVLERLDCDVIGLQEAASSGWVGRLADATEQNAAFFSSPTDFPGAVMTRFPIVEHKNLASSAKSGDVPFSRTAGAALVDIHGDLVWVINIHAHPNRQELRDAEAILLARHVGELLLTSPFMVVLGDFNSRLGTTIHNELTSRGFINTVETAGGGVSYTMTTAEGIGRSHIDHIYVSAALAGRVAASRVVTDSGFAIPFGGGDHVLVPSDHLPVEAQIQW